MSVLIFLLVLFALVLVHEFGHFIAAKKTGMRVDEFGIGFPPKLFGIKRGETEYTFNALPIGGFVKIFGEDAVDAQNAEDFSRSFVAKSKIKQAIVLVAGVTMNVLFAWLLFTIAFGIGVQSPVDEVNATENAKLMVTNVLPGSPAERAGLSEGSIILGVASSDATMDAPSPSAFTAFVEAEQGKELTVTYQKSGEVMVTRLTPETNIIVSDVTRPAVGVGLTYLDVVREPIFSAVTRGFEMTIRSLKDITVGIAVLLSDALQFNADLTQVAGPVGIVGLVGEASAFGLASLLMFTGIISLNLAIINLLPFPALDGGRLAIVVIEAIKGSAIKPSYVQAVNAVGFVLLLLLMVAVTYNDIVRLF